MDADQAVRKGFARNPEAIEIYRATLAPLVMMALTSCAGPIPISLSGYGLNLKVVIPPRAKQTVLQIPAQTIVVPPSSAPVSVPVVVKESRSIDVLKEEARF